MAPAVAAAVQVKDSTVCTQPPYHPFSQHISIHPPIQAKVEDTI